MIAEDGGEKRSGPATLVCYAAEGESVVPFRGWQRDDAKAEKYLTRGKTDLGVDAYFSSTCASTLIIV